MSDVQIKPAVTNQVERIENNDYIAALEELTLHTNDVVLYRAGIPNFPANFTRDGILSAILLQDPLMLRDQLVFCAVLQGMEFNRYTGEEPGKIFHEMPPRRLNGLSTEFNACDTTALFIYGHEKYAQMTGDDTLVNRHENYLHKAVDYIMSHLVNYMFTESPKYAGARHFALHATYWKDSQVTDRENGTPAYPAVYTLAQVQNMRALKSAAKLLKQPELIKVANEMKRHLTILYDEKRGIFYSGVDKKGFFEGTSSDNLHMLYYLEPGELTDKKIERMIEGTKILETDYGYMTLNTKDAWLAHDITHHTGYHSNTIWPFEQAFINIGAHKFDLLHVAQVSERIVNKLDTYPELFRYVDGTFIKGGSTTQLWTVAAKVYFDRLLTARVKQTHYNFL